MSFRDGSTSTFPASADSFLVKRPGDEERAAEWNQMFDACYNLEDYLSGVLGGNLQSTYSQEFAGEVVSGSNLLLAYKTVTIQVSGNTASASALVTVPSIFGGNPFNDLRFSMIPTVYIQPGAGSFESTWGDKSWGNAGPLSQMFYWPQVYTSITPSGTQFIANFHIKNFSAGGLTSGTFFDSFTRTGGTQQNSVGPSWKEEEIGNPFLIKQKTSSQYSSSTKYCLLVSSERAGLGGDPGGGWLYPVIVPTSSAQSIEWEMFDWDFGASGAGQNSNQYKNLIGVMVRATGAVTGASFYGVEIGHNLGQNIARIIKAVNVNLKEHFPTTYTEGMRPPPGPSNPNTLAGTSGTVTELASGITLGRLDTLGHSYAYRFTASGDILTLEQSVSGTAWTFVASGQDSALGTGRCGFWAKSLNGATRREHYFRDCYIRILDPSSVYFNIRLNLLFAMVGTLAKIVSSA